MASERNPWHLRLVVEDIKPSACAESGARVDLESGRWRRDKCGCDDPKIPSSMAPSRALRKASANKDPIDNKHDAHLTASAENSPEVSRAVM